MSANDGNGLTSMTLGSACDINPPRPQVSNMTDDTPVLFVPMAAVDQVTGVVTTPQLRSLGELRSKSYRTFAPGDVIFAKITPSMENGKAAIVPSIPSGLGFGSTEFHVLRPRPGVNARFIWHFLRGESFRQLARDNMTGTVGQERVPAEFLERFPIEVPPAKVQEQLARVLDVSTAAGRSTIGHLAAARQAIGRFKQAVVVTASSGRLTSDWRTSREDTPSDFHGNLAGWQRMIVGDLATRVTKGTTPTSYGHEFTDAGVAFVKVENLREGRIDRDANRSFISAETHRAQARSMLEEGDILFSIAGTIGRTAIVREDDLPANTNQALAIIRGTGHLVEPEFLVLTLRSAVQTVAEGAARGSGMNNISLADVKNFEVPLPPREEQIEIVRRVDRLLSIADGIENQIDSAANIAGRASQAILAKAFRGDLGVS